VSISSLLQLAPLGAREAYNSNPAQATSSQPSVSTNNRVAMAPRKGDPSVTTPTVSQEEGSLNEKESNLLAAVASVMGGPPEVSAYLMYFSSAS
jgi:hypothetical protein